MSLEYKNVLPPVGVAENFIVKEMFDDVTDYFATVDALYVKLTGDQTITGDITILGNPFKVTSAEATTRVLIDNTATDGDSIIEWQFNGTSVFVAGIDDSDDDRWKFSRGTTLGTNDAITVSASTGAVSIRGTNTNDAAAAAFVGERVSSSTTSLTNFPSNGAYGDANSISLTAGDWDVSFQIETSSNGGTWTRVDIGISSTSGNSSAGLVVGDNILRGIWASSSTTPLRFPMQIHTYRVSLASTTTYYGKIYSEYSAGQPQYASRLSARRVR